MNNVVNGLLEVDRQARQLLDEARQYYDKTLEETAREREKLMERYRESAKKHIADVSENEAAVVSAAVERINAAAAEKARRMEEVSAREQESWVRTMYEACIKRAGL